MVGYCTVMDKYFPGDIRPSTVITIQSLQDLLTLSPTDPNTRTREPLVLRCAYAHTRPNFMRRAFFFCCEVNGKILDQMAHRSTDLVHAVVS